MTGFPKNFSGAEQLPQINMKVAGMREVWSSCERCTTGATKDSPRRRLYHAGWNYRDYFGMGGLPEGAKSAVLDGYISKS